MDAQSAASGVASEERRKLLMAVHAGEAVDRYARSAGTQQQGAKARRLRVSGAAPSVVVLSSARGAAGVSSVSASANSAPAAAAAALTRARSLEHARPSSESVGASGGGGSTAMNALSQQPRDK